MAVSSISLAAITSSKIWSDTAQSNAIVVVQASSTVVHSIEIDNTVNAAQAVYVKIFNSAGSPTLGTTAPDEIIYAPANVKFSHVIPGGKTFGTGLQVATVTAGGTAGTTAPGTAVPVKIVYV